jgi:hypothetical protein
MTGCTRLSDQMPSVAQGTARWSATDEAHLASCDDCAHEWRLVRDANNLGSSLPALDAGRIANGVIAALREPAPAPRGRTARWAVPLALAAGLLLVMVLPPRGTPGDEAAVTFSLLPETETLSDAELESVILLIPASAPVTSGGIDSLTDDELNQMMNDLEG